MRIYQVRTFVADQTTEGRLEHRRWASNQGAPKRRPGVMVPPSVVDGYTRSYIIG